MQRISQAFPIPESFEQKVGSRKCPFQDEEFDMIQKFTCLPQALETFNFLTCFQINIMDIMLVIKLIECGNEFKDSKEALTKKRCNKKCFYRFYIGFDDTVIPFS